MDFKGLILFTWTWNMPSNRATRPGNVVSTWAYCARVTQGFWFCHLRDAPVWGWGVVIYCMHQNTCNHRRTRHYTPAQVASPSLTHDRTNTYWEHMYGQLHTASGQLTVRFMHTYIISSLYASPDPAGLEQGRRDASEKSKKALITACPINQSRVSGKVECGWMKDL